jgi:hypothetical protein
MWNDARIKALNSPAVAAALPERPIFVITVTIGNAMNELTTTALSASVPKFAAQVRYVQLLFHMRLLILGSWHSDLLRLDPTLCRWVLARWSRTQSRPPTGQCKPIRSRRLQL